MSRFVAAFDFEEQIDKLVERDRLRTAEKIAGQAWTKAPAGTGHYRDSLQAVSDDRGVVAETTDVAGHIIESGSENNPAYSPLRQAAAEVAARFEPS